MARTKRKVNPVLPVTIQTEQPQRVYQVGGYARLSVEDSGKPGADTISTQRELIQSYIDGQPDMRLYDLYCDNGRTGTNFDRPEFERLMEDVRSGKVDCIVVKDLSRFGRNYRETGNYLERIFPLLDVRFIAVNDNFDTLTAERTQDGYIVPLKNIMNAVYSKDISRKILPALATKQQNGEFIGSWAAYGYQKCADDRHRIEPDEETAAVVWDIFQWRLSGLSYQNIARKLNERGIPSPARYHYLKGDAKSEKYANTVWSVTAVKKICTDPVYLGHMVQGRKRSGFSEGRKPYKVPESEWVIVRNTHEPLVDEETFRTVQRMAVEASSTYKERLGRHDSLGTIPNILRGLIYCADCKRPLVRYKSVTNKGKNLYYVYICQTHSNDLASCPKKYFHETKGGKIESNSVTNQRNLLNAFISRTPELADSSVIEFCDDGWSGKNFERPAVQEMIAQARAGKIQCIVVKDLSRFPSIFLHFEIFGEQFGNVLCGGQARRLSGIRNFLMQVEADLRAEVLCGGHVSFSFLPVADQV